MMHLSSGDLLFKTSLALTFHGDKEFGVMRLRKPGQPMKPVEPGQDLLSECNIISQTETVICSCMFLVHLQLPLETCFCMKGFGRRHELIRGHLSSGITQCMD